MSGRHSAVCLVGAGPRGLSVLERLCAQERKSPLWDGITVHVVDPAPAGAGGVWRPSQSRHLLMNTVASQVTLFTDDSVSIQGPPEEGPSLYEWARMLVRHDPAHGVGAVPYDDGTLAEARDLGADIYPTRAFYGEYLQWVFQQVTANAPAHVTIRLHRLRAVAVRDDVRGGPQTVVLENGTRLTGLAAVVLAQGHVPARMAEGERKLMSFAVRHGLTYVAPANPADVDLSAIGPREPVLLRGLGLNFFDYMALFTHGRGGTFERVGGRLVYRPSGCEPRLHAGSRRGVPFHARGENEKGAHGRYTPRLLTVDHVATLRARAAGRPAGFGTDLWPLISKEVQCVYYEALLTARGDCPGTVAGFARQFLAAAPGAAEERLLDAAGVGTDERWDWSLIAFPYGSRRFADAEEFRGWLREHLARDVREARLGNVRGPLKAALDVLRDLRNEVRLAVDHAGLDAASHRDELERWYTPLNAFLSIGPPPVRIEEMIALLDAGVLDIVGPGMRVDAVDAPGAPAFTAASAQIPGIRVRSAVLIEARLPEPDLRRTADPLLRQLLRTGQCRPYVVPGAAGDDYETGGLAVSERPYHLLDAEGVPHPRRFAYGVPTEAVHWVTAAGIRPGVGSVTLEDSDAIAAAVLALPLPPPPFTVTAGGTADGTSGPTTTDTSASGAHACIRTEPWN
ncbi:FAD/NAD(P)-binding protein [Streptomyces phaeochromogenes]